MTHAATHSVDIQEVMRAFDGLNSLLEAENKALEAHDTGAVEKNLKEKDKLTAQVALLMKGLKERKEEAREALQAEGTTAIAELMQTYRANARKNMLLLKAAHETTASFLDAVRQAVSISKVKPNTYGKDGQVAQKQENTSLLNREI